MTIKELKEKINEIDEKYDDHTVMIENPEYDEYCLGSSAVKATYVDFYERCTKEKEYFIGLYAD